jgi:hypothetical protein
MNCHNEAESLGLAYQYHANYPIMKSIPNNNKQVQKKIDGSGNCICNRKPLS